MVLSLLHDNGSNLVVVYYGSMVLCASCRLDHEAAMIHPSLHYHKKTVRYPKVANDGEGGGGGVDYPGWVLWVKTPVPTVDTSVVRSRVPDVPDDP